MSLVQTATDFLSNSFDMLSAPIGIEPKKFLLNNLPAQGEIRREEGMGEIRIKHTRQSEGQSDVSVTALFIADYGTQVAHGSTASLKISATGDILSIAIKSGHAKEQTYSDRGELDSSTIAGLVISALRAPAKDSLSCLNPLNQLSEHLERNCTVTK